MSSDLTSIQRRLEQLRRRFQQDARLKRRPRPNLVREAAALARQLRGQTATAGVTVDEVSQ